MASSNKLNFIISAICVVSLLLSIPSAKAQEETDDEEEFSYKKGAENGPEHWGEIKKEWATCGKGDLQSPIDLSDKRVVLMPHLGHLHHSYRPADASLHNRGHDIMVKFDGDAGSLLINGTAYKLLQLHWHSPTEHTINGRKYDMELHMVHESAEKKIAVIGALYRIGRHDPFLHSLEPYIEKIARRRDKEEKVGEVDPRRVRGSSIYYRYMGSLTTPPCTEGVIWTIVKKVRTVSEHQLKLLREAVHDGAKRNARPLQEVNGRTIGIYRPQKKYH